MKITSIRFDNNFVYGIDDQGIEHAQPLDFYPRLLHANAQERSEYKQSTIGFHWVKLNEDMSYESFFYDFTDEALVCHEEGATYE